MAKPVVFLKEHDGYFGASSVEAMVTSVAHEYGRLLVGLVVTAYIAWDARHIRIIELAGSSGG